MGIFNVGKKILKSPVQLATMMNRLLLVASLLASASAFAPASRFGGTKSALSAAEDEPWTAPAEWKETDFEGELAKVQADAEKRLDEKIAELQSNIEASGK